MTNKKNTSRRGFIKQLGLLGAASTFPALKASEHQSEEKDIIYRPLGKTGIKLPIVSMGVMNATNPGVVAKSCDIGVRHFDTAWFYQGGRNERMLGQVFSDMKPTMNWIKISQLRKTYSLRKSQTSSKARECY